MFHQKSLFPLEDSKATQASRISGLTYIPDFITEEQESEVIDIINQQPWQGDLKRRVQHYGYKYDYTARRVTSDLKLDQLPDWVLNYCNDLNQKQLFPNTPDQVIINEYKAGQGIASHIDCVPCFEETIASISLGSSCVMDFIHSETNEKIPVLLEPRSLFLLNGDARYLWKHGIASRKTDKIDGTAIPRGKRISMTFRNVIIDSNSSA